jgi:ribosomal protein S18 acetylase RimI-like enzyme
VRKQLQEVSLSLIAICLIARLCLQSRIGLIFWSLPDSPTTPKRTSCGCQAGLTPRPLTSPKLDMTTSGATEFQLRRANGDDFKFCWSLYSDLMKPLTMELLGGWNESGQKQVVEQSLTDPGTSIIVADGSDIGWLQTKETPEEIYLGQLYVLPSMQNRGIGTAVVRQLADRASREGRALTLEVMKNNCARVLYERLGFGVVGSSKYKLSMRWQEGLQKPDG